MSGQHGTLEDTLYFWFAANDTSGSGGDGATALVDIRLAGALASAAPVHSPAAVLLTNAAYPAGCYEVEVDATAANGYAAGNTYAGFCTLAIDSQNPTGFIGSINLFPVISDVQEIGADAQSQIDLKDFVDAGYDPGTNKVQGLVLCDANTDMRGSDDALLAVNVPANFSDMAITITDGKITVGTNDDKTGYSIAGTLQTLDALENVAATDIVSTGAINTSAGEVSTVTNVTTCANNTDMRGTELALLAANAPANFADMAITITNGYITVGTNNDKTGYTASTVSDKTGYSISGTKQTLDALNDILATAIVSNGAITTLAGAVVNVDTVDLVAVLTTYTSNTPQSGDTFGEVGTAGAGLTDLGGMSTAMKAEVNAEALDVLVTDTFAEPGQGAPASTTSMERKIAYIYKLLRNKKEETSSLFSLYNAAGTVVDQKAVTADNGTTASKGTLISGPA